MRRYPITPTQRAVSVALPLPYQQQGFSLLELVVVIAIVAIVASVLILRVPIWQARAEMVAMENVAGSLRSALGMKVAEYIARENIAAIHTLAGSNPMDRLAELPSNYLGSLAAVDPEAVQGGHWYFDPRQRSLVYRVQHESFFRGGAGQSRQARFQVRLVWERGRSNNRRRDNWAIAGVRLVALEPYAWFIEDDVNKSYGQIGSTQGKMDTFNLTGN